MILGIGISVAFGYLAFRSISWQDVYEAVKKVQLGLLGASFLFLAVSVALSARRWQLLIGREEVHWLPTLAALVVGLMVNNVLPGRLGEIARAVFLGIRTAVSKVYLVGTVVADRLLDIAVLVLFALLLLMTSPAWSDMSTAVLIAGGSLLLAGVGALLLMKWRGARWLVAPIASRLPVRLRGWVATAFGELRAGLSKGRPWPVWLALSLLSVGVWSCMGASLFLSLLAFGIHLPFWGVGILLVVLNLGGLIPSSPGSMGTYHWLAVTTLGALGIARAEALSFALINHALWYIPQVIAGLVILWRANLSAWALSGEPRALR
jgi:hypothetical protein